jgi:hypothetical protein
MTKTGTAVLAKSAQNASLAGWPGDLAAIGCRYIHEAVGNKPPNYYRC